jgi:hypothetical protein
VNPPLYENQAEYLVCAACQDMTLWAPSIPNRCHCGGQWAGGCDCRIHEDVDGGDILTTPALGCPVHPLASFDLNLVPL